MTGIVCVINEKRRLLNAGKASWVVHHWMTNDNEGCEFGLLDKSIEHSACPLRAADQGVCGGLSKTTKDLAQNLGWIAPNCLSGNLVRGQTRSQMCLNLCYTAASFATRDLASDGERRKLGE
jgi:hypothetical protein